MRIIYYYREEEARDVHEEQLWSVSEDPSKRCLVRSCPENVLTLLTRWSGGSLEKRYRRKPTTRWHEVKREGEDEASFASSILKSRRTCGNVFCKADVVKYYVFGLKDTVREIVAQKVRIKPLMDRTNLVAVKLATVEIGKSLRALVM